MSRRVRPRPFLMEFAFLRISHLLTRKHDIGGHEFSLSSIVTPPKRPRRIGQFSRGPQDPRYPKLPRENFAKGMDP